LTRVLFLTESFHPVLGGGEVHIRALGRALVQNGMAATVVTRRRDPAWPENDVIDGIRVLRLGPTGPGTSGKYRMVPGAVRAVRRLRPEHDVLVVRGTRVLGVPGLAAARKLSLPVVLQPEINGELSGEVYSWGKEWGGLTRRLVRAATHVRNQWMRRADAFVAMSRAIEGEMLAAGVPPDRIVRIPHGVDLERFRPADATERLALRRRLNLPEAARILTYTGRLLKGKGLELLLQVFAQSLAPDDHLLLVGAGDGQSLSIEAELRARAAVPPLAGRVTFTGRVENVDDYLRASDVFVFPSEFEALGISLVEAAACGLPCVASRTGGIVDVIDHEANGLLHDPNDVAGLATCLARLRADRALGERLGRAARQRAEREFDWKRSIRRYRELFDRVAAHQPIGGAA
jgi:glycosyltransferase involved in cell wall biosynthesis